MTLDGHRLRIQSLSPAKLSCECGRWRSEAPLPGDTVCAKRKAAKRRHQSHVRQVAPTLGMVPPNVVE